MPVVFGGFQDFARLPRILQDYVRKSWGEGFGMNSDCFRLSRLILTLTASKIKQFIENHVDPSIQIPKQPKTNPKRRKKSKRIIWVVGAVLGGVGGGYGLINS